MSKSTKFSFRDILAIPFWNIGDFFLKLSLTIGGGWTTVMHAEMAIRMSEAYKKMLDPTQGGHNETK
jgi:hypothetical protein